MQSAGIEPASLVLARCTALPSYKRHIRENLSRMSLRLAYNHWLRRADFPSSTYEPETYLNWWSAVDSTYGSGIFRPAFLPLLTSENAHREQTFPKLSHPAGIYSRTPHIKDTAGKMYLSSNYCRGSGIRTHDLFVPNEARYQAAPHPDIAAKPQSF